jgi:hypothetical protein
MPIGTRAGHRQKRRNIMTFNRIAVMAEIRAHLINNTAPDSHLANRAAKMTADHTQHRHLVTICNGRYLAGALLFTRVADQLSGQAQVGALTVAALCALNGGNPGLAASAITRLEVLANRRHIEVSPLVAILKIDQRIAEQLHTSV